MTRPSTPEPSGGPDCPVAATADLIAGKWTLLMLSALSEEPRRFNELQRAAAGISPHTLTVRLRALEDAGVVLREGTRPSVYRLDESGRELLPIIDVMRSFGARWLLD